MRVAILADFPLSALTGGAVGRGGGQGCTWLPQLAQAFRQLPEVDVHWVIVNKSIRRERVQKEWNQTFHEIPCFPRSVDLLTNYHPVRWAFRRVLGAIQPSVIHTWGAEMPYPAALFDCKVPRVFSLQGALNFYKRIGGLPDEWRWNKMVSMEPKFIAAATVVTAESPWARERVIELVPGADCRVVDYGVHESFYQTDWSPDPARPKVLYAGGGGYRKGLDVLLEALKIPGPRSWEVVFAGDETLGREVQESGIRGCTFLGMLKWQELLAEMQSAWCLVVPTRADTGPTVVKEARVIGLPVVGSVHGGVRDYIRPEANGLLVDPLEPAPLRAALDSVMASYERASALGRAELARDREAFRPELTASKFIALYREIAR